MFYAFPSTLPTVFIFYGFFSLNLYVWMYWHLFVVIEHNGFSKSYAYISVHTNLLAFLLPNLWTAVYIERHANKIRFIAFQRTNIDSQCHITWLFRDKLVDHYIPHAECPKSVLCAYILAIKIWNFGNQNLERQPQHFFFYNRIHSRWRIFMWKMAVIDDYIMKAYIWLQLLSNRGWTQDTVWTVNGEWKQNGTNQFWMPIQQYSNRI